MLGYVTIVIIYALGQVGNKTQLMVGLNKAIDCKPINTLCGLCMIVISHHYKLACNYNDAQHPAIIIVL